MKGQIHPEPTNLLILLALEGLSSSYVYLGLDAVLLFLISESSGEDDPIESEDLSKLLYDLQKFKPRSVRT